MLSKPFTLWSSKSVETKTSLSHKMMQYQQKDHRQILQMFSFILGHFNRVQLSNRLRSKLTKIKPCNRHGENYLDRVNFPFLMAGICLSSCVVSALARRRVSVEYLIRKKCEQQLKFSRVGISLAVSQQKVRYPNS